MHTLFATMHAQFFRQPLDDFEASVSELWDFYKKLIVGRDAPRFNLLFERQILSTYRTDDYTEA
jgi:hypothetical protein